MRWTCFTVLSLVGRGGKEARLTAGAVDSGRRLGVLVCRRATVLAVGRREPGADRVARAGPRAVAEHADCPERRLTAIRTRV